MVLLEIDAESISGIKFEGDAPRTIDVNRVAERLLADLYPGQDDSLIARERARDIAELQSIITSARTAKAELFNKASDEPDLGELLDQYRRIDRYERRALSHKKKLLRGLV